MYSVVMATEERSHSTDVIVAARCFATYPATGLTSRDSAKLVAVRDEMHSR
jgi:hypothetical protein